MGERKMLFKAILRRLHHWGPMPIPMPILKTMERQAVGLEMTRPNLMVRYMRKCHSIAGKTEDNFITASPEKELVTPMSTPEQKTGAVNVPYAEHSRHDVAKIYNSRLSLVSKKRDWKQCLDILQNEIAADPRKLVDIFHINTVMQACLNAREYVRVIELYKGLETTDNELKPNAFTYTLAMSAYSKIGRPQEAISILRELEESDSGVTREVSIYNNALEAAKIMGNLELTFEILDTMTTLGIQPSVRTYHSTLESIGRNGSSENRVFLRHLIQNLKKNFDVFKSQGALRISPTHYRLHIKSVLITYSSGLRALLRQAMIEDAEKLFHSIPKHWLKSHGDVILFNNGIDVYDRMGQSEKVLELFDMMVAKGLLLDTYTYRGVLSSLNSSGRWEEAVQLYKQLKANGVVLSPHCYCEVIKAYGEGGLLEEAMEVVHDTMKLDIKSNSVLFTLIHNLEKYCYFDEAVAVFKKGVEKGIVPNWNLTSQNEIDFHIFPLAVARAAVTFVMETIADSSRVNKECAMLQRDLTIITGRGKSSFTYLQPVLRPQVQQMLTEDFTPSLKPLLQQNNTGRLIVPKERIQQWVNQHNQTMKDFLT